MAGISRFDLLYTSLQHPGCSIAQGPIEEFVFTDCNGGVKHAERINRLAQLMFHERFNECLVEGKIDRQRFSDVFPDDTFPEASLDELHIFEFHIFNKSDLEQWLQRSHQCPNCQSIVKEILPCPYLTQKFGERDESQLTNPPEVQKLSGEHIVNVAPSSVLQDPNELLKLFLVEMAYFASQGETPLTEEFAPEEGLIAWCLIHDKDEAQMLLRVIRRDLALSKVHLDVLKRNPMVHALKKNIDVYLESIGNIPEHEQVLGAQMQRFIQSFLGDHTNWVFFNSLLTDTNISLNYTLTDLVMIPPGKERSLGPHSQLEDVKEREAKSRTRRAFVGLVAAAMTLAFVGRRILAFFRRSKTIPES